MPVRSRAVARRWIDPNTGRYVVESGSPRGDSTRASQVVLRLRLRKGSVPTLPLLGSKLHLVEAAAQGAQRRLESYAIDALADMVADGRILELDVQVEIQEDETGAYPFLLVSFTDDSGVSDVVTYDASRVAATV